MKEYTLLYRFAEDGDEEQLDRPLDVLSTIISSEHFELLNVEVMRSEMSTILDYIELKIRFDKLNDQTDDKLSFSKKGFSLYGHTFETLDEVEKAIKNKAFL